MELGAVNTSNTVIPAKAGIQLSTNSILAKLDPRLRGDDETILTKATVS
jgi:hypothetical protein